ncbi:hypothetical protein Hypma_000879 [Hypsizygus marmoreus]|uniref:Zn(2)-C6 fungal-type domain-containing protein n=1 Tax=Hypsizygus marmoreus TaxID=39966 RepID=A0A369JEB1_HYPMA|nr:hypothetical protein Hypma_000879 [Hypsizygus marmoreus]
MQQDSSQPTDAASSPAQPAFAQLPTQSTQDQNLDFTKNLPPPRKQNTACDACRARKVKCNRLPGQDKCQHCMSKNYPCTHYVQQATTEKKRNASISRRPRNLSSAGAKYAATVLDPSGQPGAVLGRFASPPSPSGSSPMTPISSAFLDNGALPPSIVSVQQNVPLSVRYGFHPNITLTTSTRELLSYIFAPPDTVDDQIAFPGPHGRPRSPYDYWGDQASRLESDTFKAEFTLDLVEVFFQIVHTRIPLLNPAQFRQRLHLSPSTSSSNKEPLHPALVATVLAWGTKFSEHPLLVADRRRPGGQSLLAKTLIDRARDLAEALKVHRIPKSDHIIIGLLIEPLQSQIADDPTGFRGFWLTAATRHLLDLQINHKSTLATIQDAESRSTMIFAWWMACICDAYASAYYRRKPVLDDEDYDIDFYTADPVSSDMMESHGGPMSSPREQLEALGYYRAAHSLARTARSMSRQLWKPVTDAEGIPFDILCSFTVALTEWREKFLSLVGVPSNFKGDWDFVSAVSSCASDATYHVMWIILFNALDDFGVKEINNRSVEPNNARIEEVKRKVLEEALHGALRIAGLAAVLTSNGYLRLDPAVMHVSCIQAGTLLARLGRPEVKSCIDGLEQYSCSYEEAGEQAMEMGRVYNQALAGEPQFTHMGMSVPRASPDASMGGDDQDMDMQENHAQSHSYADPSSYTNYA